MDVHYGAERISVQVPKYLASLKRTGQPPAAS
jgi:hypothetical protein